MKRLFVITIAAMAMVSCGSENEIKLDDQTGFHQAVAFGGEHGLSVKEASTYDEFVAGRETITNYAEAFKTQLGGESYLAYLKCATSAINGNTLTESDIDNDADIKYLREFYKTATDSGESVSDYEKIYGGMASEYIKKMKAAKSYEEYCAVRDEVNGVAAQLLKDSNIEAYNVFVECIMADAY